MIAGAVLQIADVVPLVIGALTVCIVLTCIGAWRKNAALNSPTAIR
ncbi:hypothetical protein [Halococcus sediminicola]|nr:hypothetical protein [Halococcus sediminicola]